MIPRPSIFQEAWWLDICAPGHWRQERLETSHGVLSLTYAWRDYFPGIREICRPPLTPFLGIALEPAREQPDTSDALTLLAEGVPKLLEKLPRHIRFLLNFHPMFEWWSPFFWAGYKQTTRYTYRISDLHDLDSVWARFNSNARRNISKAQKTLIIDRGNHAGILYDQLCRTMQHQGRNPGYPEQLLVRLCEEIYARQAGEIIVVKDAQGRAHCALLVVWHNNEAYYLVGGTDPELRSSGAMSLAMWTAMQVASEHARVFDFEGSMQKGIDAFIRNFGATPHPYYQIYKKLI